VSEGLSDKFAPHRCSNNSGKDGEDARSLSPKSETAEAHTRYLSDGRIEIGNSAAQLVQAADKTRGLFYCPSHRNAPGGYLSDPGYVRLPTIPAMQPTHHGASPVTSPSIPRTAQIKAKNGRLGAIHS
jgi:hypothetical protein